MAESRSNVYEFGEFRLDPSKRTLTNPENQSIALTPKAFDTLLYIVEHRGTVVDREELMKAVWPDTVVEENNLSQSISALRRAFGEGRGEHRYIVTLPGRGYRFVPEVRTRAADATTSDASPIKVIAVLPFKPLVGENRDIALEMGMADTLIARLGSIRELSVRPISSVRKYADLEQDPLAAGRELGVESVLEGSLQRWGDKIRVTVRLVNVLNGVSLWAGTFDEKFTDIFALEDAISERVVGALSLELSSQEKGRLTKHYTESTEAYQLYLRGRYHWWKTAREDFDKSREYFQRSVEADPSYALGYCGLNSYYGFGAAWGILPPNQAWPQAEAAIMKALELDDQLAEARTGLAALQMVRYRDWTAAEREAKRGIELNPGFDEIHYVYSFYLAVMGRLDEAIAECKRALKIDPFSLRINQHLGNCLFYARRYDEAITQYCNVLELEPGNAAAHESLGDAFEQKGTFCEAVAEWERAMRLVKDEKLAAILTTAYDEGGLANAARAVAQEKLERLNRRVKQGEYIPAINFARIFVRLKDKERAFRHLRAACAERNVYALLVNSDPFYDSLRDDPRFRSLILRIGLI